jgi:hypothetical protein
MNLNKLAVGGPFNGQHVHWSGDIVEYPNDVTYRAARLKIDDEVIGIYIFASLSNSEALELIKSEYMGI